MPCSGPFEFLSVVFLRVKRIKGGDWRSFDVGGHPIVFERRNINESERLYSIYDNEIIAIMHALTKFRQYLVGSRFVVNTNHNSLKYFLDQKLANLSCSEVAYELELSKGINIQNMFHVSFLKKAVGQ